ncbi:lasso RiPP family leader peptide-containing protein [Streptomyces sp. NPDC020845]
MNAELDYQTPMLIEIGDFTEVTRAVRDGYWIDFFGAWWF